MSLTFLVLEYVKFILTENIEEVTQKRKRLKLGAKPCYHIICQHHPCFFQIPQRKPSAIRYQSETIQHKTFEDVKQSY